MPFSLKMFLAAVSRPSPKTYCGVMVYQRLALGRASTSGRTVCSMAPKVGADQRKVALLQSLPVISSAPAVVMRSEEHTSELQSQSNLVCRLLLEKKKS